MKRKAVLLLAKTGYIIRDILLGKFTDEIIKDMDLIVAVPNPYDVGLRKCIEGKPIELIPFYYQSQPKNPFSKYLSVQHWMYRFKEIERNNSSLVSVSRLWQHKFSHKTGRLVELMSLIGKAINKFHLMGIAEKLFLTYINRQKITEQWKDLLSDKKPSYIVSTMLTLPESMFVPSVDLPVVLAARELKIPCGTLVQSWDNLSSKTYLLPSWLDRYWTWSDAMSEDLIRFNPRVNTDNIRVVNSPHFDFHLDPTLIEPRASYLSSLGLDPDRPYILIGTGIKFLLPHEPVTVNSLVERLRAENSNVQVLLRFHPKDDGSRWLGYLDNFRNFGVVIQNTSPSLHMDEGGYTPPQDFFREQVNTIHHASVVINTASSISVDAAVLNRPIISIGYDKVADVNYPEGRSWHFNHSEHFGALVKTGGIWVVQSEEQCISAINTYISHPEHHELERRLIVEKVTGHVDGTAGIRLAKEIQDLI